MKSSQFNVFAEIGRRKVIQTFLPYLGFVWLILQVLSVVTPMFQLSQLFNTLIAVTLFAGMPIMLYLSWYFDFTKEGLVAIPDLGSEEASSFGAVRWSIFLIITICSGLIAFRYFSAVQLEYKKADDGMPQVFIADSITVLPFKDTSPEQNQDFLAIGVAEEISSLLSRTVNFTVAAFSSSRILYEKEMDPVSIAKRLNVKTVLTGSVRLSGDQLRVRVELLSAEDSRIIWSESFSRKLTDVFSIETEIARATVNRLQDTFTAQGQITNTAVTSSAEAYVLYLRGREEYRKQTTESMKEARTYFEQAIGLDPEYAQAYAALADTILLLAEGPARFGVLKTNIAARLARENIEKAIVRQPEMPEAYALLGYIPYMLNEPEESLPFFDKAISLNPNLAIAKLWKSQALKSLQRNQESLEALELAQQLDPLSLTISFNLGLKYLDRGEFDKATFAFEQLLKDFPESPLGYAGMANVTFSQGNFASSLSYWKQAYEATPESVEYKFNYMSALLSLGLTEQAKLLTDDPAYTPHILFLENKRNELLELMDFQLSANPEDPWIAFESSWYRSLVGDREKAIEQLVSLKSMFDENEIYDMPYCSPAIEISWALQNNNDIDNAAAMQQKCQAQLLTNRENGIVVIELDYLAARLAALKGLPDEAIQHLSTAIENGWRETWTKTDPVLESIRHLPEFEAQMAIISSDIAAQKEKALNLIKE